MDSKSADPCGHGGSTPPPGTNKIKSLSWLGLSKPERPKLFGGCSDGSESRKQCQRRLDASLVLIKALGGGWDTTKLPQLRGRSPGILVMTRQFNRSSRRSLDIEDSGNYEAIPRPTRLAAAMMTMIPAHSRRTGLPRAACHSPRARPTKPPKST